MVRRKRASNLNGNNMVKFPNKNSFECNVMNKLNCEFNIAVTHKN